MRILDKYIIKELLGPFLFGVASFSSIIIGTSTLFRIAQYVTQYGASLYSVTRLFLYSLPSIVVLTFPMSMLLAALMAFGRLSGSSEITAMRSGGISFYRLSAPVFVVALFVSIFSIGFNELVVPQSTSAYNQIIQNEIMKSTTPKSQEHIIIKDLNKDGSLERLTYARRYDEASQSMQGVVVEEFDNERMVRVENADRAEWQNERWIMYNGVINDLSTEGNVERTMRFNQQFMPVSKNPKAISQEQKKPDEMTIRELRENIKALQREFINTKQYEVELHQRFAVAMASFLFAMIGTPLGLQPNRSSSSIGLGLSIIIIFIYYIIMTTAKALGQGGAIAPMLSAWIPNLVAFVAGLFLIHRASK